MKIGTDTTIVDVMIQNITTLRKMFQLVVTFATVEFVNIMSPEKIIIVFGWTLAYPMPISTLSFPF